MLTRHFMNGDIADVLRDIAMGESPFDRRPALRAAPFPPLNVHAEGDAYVITAEIPGVDGATLDITADEDVITIKGKRISAELPEGAMWLRREREYGDFSRSVRMPFAVSPGGVEASASNGVLSIRVVKPAEKKPMKIAVKTA